MKKYISTLFTIIVLSTAGFSQIKTQVDTLIAISVKETADYSIRKAQAIEWANRNGLPVKREVNGIVYELQYIDKNGKPQYYTTENSNAAATISTNKVYPGGSAGLNLNGSGITVREWDEGSILSTHQEFDTRVTNMESASISQHSTHVAGTIMASGVNLNAKGMAYGANLRSYDWNNDGAEMASEAASGSLLSNHSYGFLRGWSNGTWYGDISISTEEDYLFGFYDAYTRLWDQVANNAPFYLICKSSGNDRGNSGTGHPADGPYDCIGQQGVAKNILTVGAVDDIPGGYTTPPSVVMSYFSSWGPADDGRIKPDIVANGINLFSTNNSGNTNYATMSGTSMATPSATGSLTLLQQHYFNVKGAYMLASTLKALVIHTADEAGTTTGPDYMFGWGLMNTDKAALKITEDGTADVISEITLNNGGTFTKNVVALGTSPLRVTIVWNDPAGTPVAASLDPLTPMLVNDLDLRITKSSTTYYPWKLDRDNPANAATNAVENNVDNVEVVYIASPVAGETYTITVDHDGTLASPQVFSMILSGAESFAAPVANFIANITEPAINTQVNFTDNSLNTPTSWAWSFTPSTVSYLNGTTSTSANPQVEFKKKGYYTVSLTATNGFGGDTETKTNYINAFDCLITTLPFTESFNSIEIPNCWTQADHQGNGQIWQFGTFSETVNPNLSGNYAFLNSDNYGSEGSQNADLISPVFDFSNYTNIILGFNHFFVEYETSSGTLSYSINNGSSWTDLQTWTTTSVTNPATFSMNLTAQVAGQSQVLFKWNYTGTWAWYWAVDDVSLTGDYLVGATENITNVTIDDGESKCYDATNTITVAGGGTYVDLLNGSTSNFIAGQTVSFLPGFHAQEGSYMYAWITTEAAFCNVLPSVVENIPIEKSVLLNDEINRITPIMTDKLVKVYPNPNNGRFTVLLTNFEGISEVLVTNTLGAVISRNITSGKLAEFELPYLQKGIFIVTVKNGQQVTSKKIIVH